MRRHFLVLVTALRATASLLAQSGPQPVHHWPLDEGAGTLAADISGGEHGTLQPGSSWNPAGRFGGAMSFNGANGRVDMGPCDMVTGPGTLTLSLWMKTGLMAGNEQVLLAKTDGPGVNDHVWSLSQVNSTAIRFRVRSGGTVTELTTQGSSLFSGSWYHVCGVYDGNEMRIYLNGALMAFTSASGNLAFAPWAIATMGGRVDGSGNYLGTLDDVRIYDQALSDMEVFALVLGNVSVGLAEEDKIIMGLDGLLRAPQGTWDVHVLDAAGRTVSMYRAVKHGQPLPVSVPSPGIYVACLFGRERTLSAQVFVP